MGQGQEEKACDMSKDDDDLEVSSNGAAMDSAAGGDCLAFDWLTAAVLAAAGVLIGGVLGAALLYVYLKKKKTAVRPPSSGCKPPDYATAIGDAASAVQPESVQLSLLMSGGDARKADLN